MIYCERLIQFHLHCTFYKHMHISGPISDTLEFLTQPSNITVTQNMSATFQCSVSSTFTATIEWIFTSSSGGQSITIANQQGSHLPEYNVITSVNGLSLVIRRASFSTNQGIYTCQVTSNGRTISATASINVLCEYFVVLCN